MSRQFSVVLLSESGHKHEQLVPVLAKSCRDFKHLFNVEELIRLTRTKRVSVLMFGYNSIEQSEVAYFRLLKTDPRIEERIGCAMLLCNKTEVRQAFQLCRKGLFNDYFISAPLYDPYHLLLRFRQLKALQAGEAGLQAVSSSSLNVVCESLEQIVQADGRVADINLEMLQRLGETINRAMTALSQVLDQQFANGGVQNGSTAELIFKHQQELVNNPIHGQVSEAVSRVQQVMAEATEVAIEQRVALGNSRAELSPRQKRIAVVEDNAESVRKIQQVLERCECEALIYRYGTDLAKDIDKLSPDIFMIDLTLPDITAFHLIEKIRKSPRQARARIFVLAQTGDKERVEIAINMGVDEVILKPLDEHVFTFKLSQY